MYRVWLAVLLGVLCDGARPLVEEAGGMDVKSADLAEVAPEDESGLVEAQQDEAASNEDEEVDDDVDDEDEDDDEAADEDEDDEDAEEGEGFEEDEEVEEDEDQEEVITDGAFACDFYELSQVANCPASDFIGTADVCRRAAAAVGKKFSHVVSNQASRPRGCFHDPNGLVYFNTRTSSSKPTWARGLCKRNPKYYAASAVANCPANRFIDAEQECRRAATAVGKRFQKVVSNQASRPRGCFHDPNGLVYFNTRTSLTKPSWARGMCMICRATRLPVLAGDLNPIGGGTIQGAHGLLVMMFGNAHHGLSVSELRTISVDRRLPSKRWAWLRQHRPPPRGRLVRSTSKSFVPASGSNIMMIICPFLSTFVSEGVLPLRQVYTKEEMMREVVRAGINPTVAQSHIDGNFRNNPSGKQDIWNMEGATNEHVTSTGIHDCQTSFTHCRGTVPNRKCQTHTDRTCTLPRADIYSRFAAAVDINKNGFITVQELNDAARTARSQGQEVGTI